MSDTELEFDIESSNVSESLLKQEKELLRRNRISQKNSMRIVKQAESSIKESRLALEESGTTRQTSLALAAEGYWKSP
jgi:HKD family nuclease